MKQKQPIKLLPFLAAALSTVSALQAQNTFYADGDLVLYFQKPGNSNTVYVGLGSAANLYRGGAAGASTDRQALNIVNIDSALTTAFGGTWASDPGLFAGLAAAASSSASTTLVIAGDPVRTLYASQPRSPLGTAGFASSVPWDFSTSGFSGPTTNIIAMNSKLETLYTTQAAVSPVSTSTIDDQNPITISGANFLQASAFGAFPGGVQQKGSATALGTFGAAGTVEFALDLYRIVPRVTAPGQITGPDKTGSFEGTVTVGSTGQVSFITQGTATAYDAWISAFSPPLSNPSDRLPTADPDNDGTTNLMEFVLNGNPTTPNTAIVPVLDASGSNFIFSFNRCDDSESDSTQVFQYGSDLAGWAGVTVGSTSSTAGNVTVTVNELGTSPDAITVSVPKTVAVDGKLFGRLKVEQ